MFKIEYDDRALIAKLSDIEKQQLPFATMLALNDSMFLVRDAWAREVSTVFEEPTPLTTRAVLYKKATKQELVADVFVRKHVHKGTPPSRYLISEVTGGPREAKPIEFLLRRAGVLGGDEFVVPAEGFPLDQYGNVPASVQKTILVDLQATRDAQIRSTPESRRKRSRRKSFGGRGVYFLSRGAEDLGGGKIQHLPRGIYQRTRFATGSALRMVLAIVKGAPVYSQRFDAGGLAQRTFNQVFPQRFKERLRFAVATARTK